MADRRTSSWKEYDQKAADTQEAARQIGYKPQKERRTNAWKIADAEAAIDQYNADRASLLNEQLRMEIEGNKKKMMDEEEKAKSKSMLDKLLRKSFETTEGQNKKIDQRNPAFTEEQYIEREMRKAKQPVSREDALQKSDMVGKNVGDILGNAMSGKDTNLDSNMSNYADQRQQERSAMQQPDTAILDKLKASYKDTYLPGIEKQEAEKRSRLKSEFTPQFAKEQTEAMATGAGYSDSSDVVRKSGVFNDRVMTPTIGEMSAAKNTEMEDVSSNPKIKRLQDLAKSYDAQGDEKLANQIRTKISDYLFKSAIGEEKLAGEKDIQGAKFAQDEKMFDKRTTYEKSRDEAKNKFEMEKLDDQFKKNLEILGVKDKYDKQNMQIENAFKAQREKAKKEAEIISKSAGSKDYIKAYNSIDSDYVKEASDFISYDQQVTAAYNLMSDPKTYDNPAAKGAIQAAIVRGINREKGVITDSDIDRSGLDQSYAGKIKAWYESGSKGTFPVESLEDAKKLLTVLKIKGNERRTEILDEKIMATSDAYGIDPERMKQSFKPYYARIEPIEEGANPFVKPTQAGAQPKQQGQLPKATKAAPTPIDGGFKTRSGNSIIFE